MDRIPFSIYDIFGCLVPGFLLLVAYDYGIGSATLLQADPDLLAAFFIAMIAYICGHLIAGIAGFTFERGIVRHLLKPPEVLLFRATPSRLRWLLPGYCEPLPEATQKRVLTAVEQQCGRVPSPRALFYLCFDAVKRDEATGRRLQTFLYLYGFCRNLSAACLLATLPLLANGLIGDRLGLHPQDHALQWAIAAVIASVGLFYRYLTFYRHYTVEVFRSYPALAAGRSVPNAAVPSSGDRPLVEGGATEG